VQVPDSFIVEVVPPQAAPEITVADVILGSVGLTGVLVLAALALGALLALALVFWNRTHPPADAHLPSVSPFAPDSPAPPSSPAP